jgi:hypothetical protein
VVFPLPPPPPPPPPPPHNNNNIANNANNANEIVDRIGRLDQMFMDQLRVDNDNNGNGNNDRANEIPGVRNLRRAILDDSDSDDDDDDDDENGMPGLIARNLVNDDSSSDDDEDDIDDDDDGINDDNDSATGRYNPQIPFVVNNRYRYNIHNVPNQLWPILLERANSQNRFINGIYHKPSGLYYLLRKGPLLMQNHNQIQQQNQQQSQGGENN